MPQLGLGLRANVSSSSLYDADAASYFSRAGVTNATAKIQINEFVKGLKSLGIYNNIVCWPLRSSQNAGTGTTAYSLGGLGIYNGTLTNGPTWGANGVNFVTASGTRIVTSAIPFSNSISLFNVTSHTAFGAASGDYSATFGVDPSYQVTGLESFITGSSGSRALNVWLYRTGGLASDLNVSIPNDSNFLNTFHAYGISGSSTNNARLYDATTANLTQSTPVVASSSVIIGAQNTFGGRPMTGRIPFHLVSTASFTASQFSSLYSLYNSTLGSDLYDPDAEAYFTTAGITDTTAKRQISDFVVGVKELGLWNDMVCWPLRSTQNAGSGTTAYSLGGFGTYNGTLVNSPSWGVDGITFTSGSSQTITIPNINISKTDVIVATCQAATSGNLRVFQGIWGADALGIWAGFNGIYFWDVRSTAGTLNRQSGGSAPTTRRFTHGIASTSGASFFVNGTSILSNAVSSTNANLSTVRINENGGNGNIAFAMFSQSITGNASLYNLYKTTLGTGLGLP
jgi:hypothetical protein